MVKKEIISTDEFINVILNDFSYGKVSASVSILTESDGDFFIDICKEEGGGIDSVVESFFCDRPVGEKVTFSELIELLQKVKEVPLFTSKDGSITLQYLLHVWIGPNYLIYSPSESILVSKKMTWIDKLFHPVGVIE